MVTISVDNSGILPLAIHVITGLSTVACLVCCAVTASEMLEMGFWLLGALVAFSLNRFGSGFIGRMIAI